MKMYAFGWKKYENIYTVQVNEINQKDKTDLKKIFKDWNESGIGWNLKSGDKMMFFSKPFKDQKEWLSWAKECPIKLTEVRAKANKDEYVELNFKTKKKRAKK
jgi:hypothetical protein